MYLVVTQTFIGLVTDLGSTLYLSTKYVREYKVLVLLPLLEYLFSKVLLLVLKYIFTKYFKMYSSTFKSIPFIFLSLWKIQFLTWNKSCPNFHRKYNWKSHCWIICVNFFFIKDSISKLQQNIPLFSMKTHLKKYSKKYLSTFQSTFTCTLVILQEKYFYLYLSNDFVYFPQVLML